MGASAVCSWWLHGCSRADAGTRLVWPVFAQRRAEARPRDTALGSVLCETASATRGRRRLLCSVGVSTRAGTRRGRRQRGGLARFVAAVARPCVFVPAGGCGHGRDVETEPASKAGTVRHQGIASLGVLTGGSTPGVGAVRKGPTQAVAFQGFRVWRRSAGTSEPRVLDPLLDVGRGRAGSRACRSGRTRLRPGDEGEAAATPTERVPACAWYGPQIESDGKK